jgi:hypothetical protein
MQQVTKRLDRLIFQIREIQRPHMNGDQPADVLIVRSPHPLYHRFDLRES